MHPTTPGGSNSASVAWSTALVSAGRNITSMPIGNNPGQITQSEADQITAGTVFEVSFQWDDNPSWTNAQRNADLTSRATQNANIAIADLQNQFKYFGFTVA